MNRIQRYQSTGDDVYEPGESGIVEVYPSSGALTISRFQREAVEDRCTALLAKNSLDNAAMLVSYASHLCSANPEGAEIYTAIVKGYAVSATRRIVERGNGR